MTDKLRSETIRLAHEKPELRPVLLPLLEKKAAKTSIPSNASLFLIHESGANHILQGKKLVKLLRELEAGRGGRELLNLVENGYWETMGGNSVDSLTFETAFAEATGNFK